MNAFCKLLNFIQPKLTLADYEKFLKILVLYTQEVGSNKEYATQIIKNNKSIVKKINQLRRDV